MRTGPRRPWLGAAGFRVALKFFEWYFERKHIYRSTSQYAAELFCAIADKLARGETVYLAGISAAGTHNSGVALIEVTREHGPRLICNNEEERLFGEKHTNRFPDRSITALLAIMKNMGLGPERIDAWLSSWDSPALFATLLRTALEEAPKSFSMVRRTATPLFNLRDLDRGTRAARRLGRHLGL